MYLKSALVENNGSIEWMTTSFDLDGAGNPKPIILLGANGSGKTNFLSLITDALFEAASEAFDGVLPSNSGKRSYFRTVGGRNIRSGATGSVAALLFEHNGQSLTYTEKAGEVDAEQLKTRSPTEFHGAYAWKKEEIFKSFPVSQKTSEAIFKEGIYCYFPSDRSEVPYWQNPNNGIETRFSINPKYRGKIPKPIYVDRAISDFSQWIIGVLADSRVQLNPPAPTETQYSVKGDIIKSIVGAQALDICNTVLQIIMDDPDVEFTWIDRKSNQKVAINKKGVRLLPDLVSLSTGQAILLGMFGTLLKHADMTSNNLNLRPEEVQGICLVDEIDSHIHLDLQYRAIPKLMRIFPKVQFICSSHSPIFALGIEEQFGPNGAHILRMPDGFPITAETFTEFLSALNVVKATRTFDEILLSNSKARQKPIIYLEGQTDPLYFQAALSARSRENLSGAVEFQWIGAHDANGRAFNTGKDALIHARKFFLANPKLAAAGVLLLGDNDTNFTAEDIGGLHIRSLPSNNLNEIVRDGIENLLPTSVFEERFFNEKITRKSNGQTITVRDIDKTQLCEYLCSSPDRDTFAAFDPVLQQIADIFGIPEDSAR